MKSIFLVAAIITASTILSFSIEKRPTERTYYISLTETQVNNLAYIIDHTTAEHNVVMELQNSIARQISQQVATFKTSDSTQVIRDSLARAHQKK